MMTTIKDETGAEKRIVELSLLSFEKIIGSSSTSGTAANDNIVKFTNDSPDELIGEDEIPF